MVCCCVLYRMIVYVQVAELYWIVHLYGLSPVWTLRWRFRDSDWLNTLAHTWHLYGLPPVWTLMCRFKCPDWLNALSHTWHLYGFSPLCILLCLTRLPDVVNRLPQTVHSIGFSPEWLCLCLVKWLPLWQHWPHSVHLYLPAWIFIWFRKPLVVKNCFSHWLHEYNFSPLCVISWFCNCSVHVNRLLHVAHINGLSPVCILLWRFKPLLPVNCLSPTVLKYDPGLSWCGWSLMSLRLAWCFTTMELPIQQTSVDVYLVQVDKTYQS